MRLIDADALLEKLKGAPRYFNVKFDIEEMPTAYDVEKVVKQLNEESFYSIECGRCNANYRAIEIVRKGGVE